MIGETFVMAIALLIVMTQASQQQQSDDVCNLPKVVGDCRAAIQRFFYNKDTGECEEFLYGGCKGNGNNFETKEECEKRCKS